MLVFSACWGGFVAQLLPEEQPSVCKIMVDKLSVVLEGLNHGHRTAVFLFCVHTITRKTIYLTLTRTRYIYLRPLVGDQVLYSYRMQTDYPCAYVRIDRVIDRYTVAVLYGRTHCDYVTYGWSYSSIRG